MKLMMILVTLIVFIDPHVLAEDSAKMDKPMQTAPAQRALWRLYTFFQDLLLHVLVGKRRKLKILLQKAGGEFLVLSSY